MGIFVDTAVENTRNDNYDIGLRTYMNNIFKYMSLALLISGFAAFLTANTPFLLNLFYGTPLSIVVMFAPLIFFIYYNSKIWAMSPEKARNNLFIFSLLNGISLAYIFIAFSPAAIVKTFFVTSAMFAGMSLFGYKTKTNLTSMGQFLFMGLLGILIASLVNLFMRSPGIDYVISFLGVIIFSGLTAYDMQRLKHTYDYVGINSDVREKVAIIGALNLYLDFINLFLMMLRLTSSNNK